MVLFSARMENNEIRFGDAKSLLVLIAAFQCVDWFLSFVHLEMPKAEFGSEDIFY